MTPSMLKYKVEKAGNEPYFFTRKTMKFFGDTMRNYGVCDAGDCWELFRRRPVKYGVKSSAYFSKETLKRVFPEGKE